MFLLVDDNNSSLSPIVLTEIFFDVVDSPKTIVFRCCNNIVIIYDTPQEAIDEALDASTAFLKWDNADFAHINSLAAS